jgi:aerobic carbon-monoxide dehydrogenase medium subunit
MKPSSFDYHRPTGLGEALAVLAEAGQHGKVLAGGQSLVPVLNMRLAAPRELIDINSLAELAYIRVGNGGVEVGALARHADVERDDAAHEAIPLLRRATRHVAHATIRNRGTTVGSLVHADPSGEMPAVLALLDGSVTLASTDRRRTVAAKDFFVGPLESCLRPGELAVSATFRTPPARTGSAWHELSRRHGDYAMCGVGVLVTLDPDRRVAAARAAYISVGPTPVLVDLTDSVIGQHADTADWVAAGTLATGAVEPEDDIHATAAYRRHLVGVLTARAARAAAQEASAHVRA